MSNVIKFPEPVDSYFGVCPTCHRHDGFLDVGREHWFYCKRHRVKWMAGSNLFSAWKDLSEVEHQSNAYRLSEMRDITFSGSESGSAA